MRLGDLVKRLQDIAMPDREVVLIVNGVAYPVIDVWWEKLQNHTNSGRVDIGAVCIGDDPR